MKLRSYPLLIIRNTHGVVAYLEGLDNLELYGEGRTIREAKTALRKAFEFYLESCRKENSPVPASNVTSVRGDVLAVRVAS